ncbi:flagellin [Zavarzinia sp.]|uniref:flagellin n=1 Tax=Zavarzinia sp. TaxID=2027920 RepID=UPI00356B2E3C
MLSVTTYASQLQTLANIKRNQDSFAELSAQVATGEKSADLSTYGGTDARRVINADQQVSRLTAYNKAIDIVTPTVKEYSVQIDHMDDLASAIGTALSGANTFDKATANQLGTQIDNALRDLTSMLNEKNGNRYLWSGGNYDTAPVTDLTTLPDLATPAAFTPVTDPTLPDYYAAAPGTDASAWTEASFSPEVGKTVQYGQVASAEGIQQLIYGLQLAKSGLAAAAAAPDSASAETAYDSFREQAQSVLKGSRDGLKSLSTQVSLDLASITTSRDTNTAQINLFKDERGKITDIDTAEAGVKLNQVQIQLDATYQIVAKLTSTSLVNYL